MKSAKIGELFFTASLGLIYSGILVAPVVAAQIGQSGGGLSFTCDADLNKCTCSGSWKGADCQAMLKNCKGATKQRDGTYKNVVLECATGSAVCLKWTCDMSRKSKTWLRYRSKIIAPPQPPKIK